MSKNTTSRTVEIGPRQGQTAESGRLQTSDPGYVGLLGERLDGGWRGIVRDAGVDAIEQAGGIDQLADAIRTAIGGNVAINVDNAILNTLTRAVDLGILIGYALGKTWPTGPEDLHGWPAKAAKYAGIPTSADVDQGGVS